MSNERAPASDGPDVVLEIRNLSVDYGVGREAAHAVDDVTLSLRRGEVLGVAGESGCGKSTLAYAMTRLLRPPARVVGGEVTYRSGDEAIDIFALDDAALRRMRWDELAIVFQSAMNALNPVFTLRASIHDVLVAHRPQMNKRERDERTAELLALVGISADRINAYPHELSGGMRQRAMIALALALDPEVIVMDEPTTALDVVMQRQILNEISRLRAQLDFSVIFITHDLSLLIEIADTIAVMYGGRLVELAGAREFYARPGHPYSQGLLDSFPLLKGPPRELTGIPGFPPDLRTTHLMGCPFAPRCSQRIDRCDADRPELRAPADAEMGHSVACHRRDEQSTSHDPPAREGSARG